jgi:hypothetical protein
LVPKPKITDNSELEPVVGVSTISPSLARERKQWDTEIEALELYLAPRIAERIDAAQRAVDALASIHRDIIDHTDIDLRAGTRWVAVLEVTARCISIADSLVDQLRSGYAGETAGACRVLHEALDLAIALAAGDREELTRWLHGQQYPTRRAQQERTAFFGRLAEQYADALGRKLEEEPALREQIEGLADAGAPVKRGLSAALHSIGGRAYGELSSTAHNRRNAIGDGVAPGLRRFTYGPHPDPRVRGNYVQLVDGLVEQAVLDVGAALAEIVGFEAVGQRIAAILDALKTTRSRVDLSVPEEKQ